MLGPLIPSRGAPRGRRSCRLPAWRPLAAGWLLGLVLFAGMADAASDNADATGRAEALLETYFEATRSLQGNFNQITRDASGNVVEAARGRFWLARGERFRWHYRTPWEQVIVADGKRLWVHDVDLEQVTVRPLGEALGVGAAQLLSGELANLRDKFRIETGQGEGSVRLRPTDPAWDFQAVTIHFDQGVPVRIAIEAGLGDRIEVAFSDLQRNATIEPGRFEFNPPQGVDVIEGT